MSTLATSDPSNSLKINARLSASAAAQLNALTRKTGLGISEIVRLSLAHYHETMMQANQPKAKSRIVSMAGKYGSQGPDAGTLSTRYKELYAQGIAAKYGLAAKTSQVKNVTSR